VLIVAPFVALVAADKGVAERHTEQAGGFQEKATPHVIPTV
jgi:hypothetical protein